MYYLAANWNKTAGMIPIYLYDTNIQIYDTDIALKNQYTDTDTIIWRLLHKETDLYRSVYRLIPGIG